jgi:hypothetical protein
MKKLEVEFKVRTAEEAMERARQLSGNLSLPLYNSHADTFVAEDEKILVVMSMELPKVHEALWEANRWKLIEIMVDGLEWAKDEANPVLVRTKNEHGEYL